MADSLGGDIPPNGAKKLEDDQLAIRQELIKHLSSEIATEAKYIASFRGRMAFTFLTGPFIVMGSLLVAFKGPFAFSVSHRTHEAYLGLAILYLLLSVYAAGLDQHSSNRCDRWRKAMVSLASGNGLKDNDVVFKQYQWQLYPAGFLLMIALVGLLAFLVTQAVPSSATPENSHLLPVKVVSVNSQ